MNCQGAAALPNDRMRDFFFKSFIFAALPLLASFCRADDLTPRFRAGSEVRSSDATPVASERFRVSSELRTSAPAPEESAPPEKSEKAQAIVTWEDFSNPFAERVFRYDELGAFGLVSANVEQNRERYQPLTDPRARLVPGSDRVFKSDPVYNEGYNAEEQLYIYGGKHLNPTARPLIELGRELYQYGPLQSGIDLFGTKNLVFPQFFVFGDFRTAIAYNDNGAKEKGVFAAKLNLDVDIRITATERIHAFFTPLDRDGQVSRFDFGGNDRDSKLILNPVPQALFFEGDLARIAAGLTDTDNKLRYPVHLWLDSFDNPERRLAAGCL